MGDYVMRAMTPILELHPFTRPGRLQTAPDAGAAFVFLGDQLQAQPTGPGSLGHMFVFRGPGGLRVARDRPNDFFRAAGSRQHGMHASVAILI
ncbi:hypothetical protein HPB51_006261 [Rhipicephalus microplus]|uniref:Uncharacterized protein n=1 Tax=Rhipicephalus microplus TaxID=6941 RepID=A0A9J6DLE7_RHIMP|nr:hypothetical protein HPB51_006261 [Rhipicephalus microplus]